jgi:hypothetical protein
LDRTIWGGKFEAIVESEKYDTLTVNELFSKLKLAEVDRGMTAKLEGLTDSHSLSLVDDSKGKANTNPSTKIFSLSSLMSMPDEEFDVLGEDELALLMRRFERLHEKRVNMRRNTRTCFQCGKPGHFIADCPVLQAQVKNGWQVPIEARPQEEAQEQAQGRATIEEEGESRQGPSDGWSERRRLQFRVLHLELKQQ